METVNVPFGCKHLGANPDFFGQLQILVSDIWGIALGCVP